MFAKLSQKKNEVKMGWQRTFLMLWIVVAIALSACSPAQFRTEAAKVPRLVFSSLEDPKTFNTVLSKESNDVFGFIYDGLLTQNGVTGELEPDLAESWQISKDQQEVTFTLRDGLKWSDGAPFTVDDIVFTFNQLYFNEKIPSSARDILRVGESGAFPKVTKVDDRRVKFTSPEPFAPLLRYAGGIPVLPKHLLADTVRSTDSSGQPKFLSVWGTGTPVNQIVGNGPYRIKSYTPAQRIILERNPYYWRKDAQGNSQPYIEQIVLEIVESTDASLVQFRSGGLDAEDIRPDYFALIKREEKRGHFKIYNGGPALTTTFITFNLNKGSRNGKPLVDPIKSRWFNTLEFRQAVAHAIDRQSMINNTYQGLGAPQNSPIVIQSPYYLAPEAGLPTYDYNLTKAKELLLKAGFQYNPTGQLLDQDGNLVRFTLITNAGNKIRESLGSQIKQDLSKIGIQVDFQPIDFNTLIRKIQDTLNWDCHLLGFSGGGVEPDGGRNIWSVNGGLHSFNQKNLTGAPDPGRVVSDWETEIDRLYIQGSQQLNDSKRKAIYAETQRLAQQYLPFIHLVNAFSLSAVRDRVQGIKFSALGGSFWNVYEQRVVDQ
jgi:peptide/nickel transport system substrate-binding protein